MPKSIPTINAIANLDIINARLPGYKDLQRICISEGKISGILPTSAVFQCIPPPDLQVLDVAGNWISLGGVDLQINGGLGLAFTNLQAQDNPRLQEICEFLWQQGVDAFLPTLVTTSVENIGRSLVPHRGIALLVESARFCLKRLGSPGDR